MHKSSALSTIWPDGTAKATIWPSDMGWISDLRAIDQVKSSMIDRIADADTLTKQITISRYCEEVAQSFSFLAIKALKVETK